MYISSSKIIRRSKRLSPIKLASSPAKVDDQITTSQNVDTISHDDLPHDSDTELDLTVSSPSWCTSCYWLKKRIKGLQKKICWYKKTKASLKKKITRLEAENVVRPSLVSNIAAVTKDFSGDDESEEGDFNEVTSMDYSSLEESSQSTEMDEEVTRNTVR